MSTISKAYQQFREENYDILSEDMFRKLRPPNVVLMGGSGTHKICCCIHCENPNLMITTSILAKLESFQCLSKDSKQVTPKSLVQLLVCPDPDEECYLSNCDKCSHQKEDLENKISIILQSKDISSIEYSQWSFNDNSQKETFLKNSEDFSATVTDSMNSFKLHYFLNKQQSKYLYNLKKNPPEGTMLISMDYAENYSCVSQNEVQKAYFRKVQISMLTVYVYMMVQSELKEQSYVVLTDDTRHETPAVYSSYQKLNMKLDKMFPPRSHTIIMTDGCAGIDIAIL